MWGLVVFTVFDLIAAQTAWQWLGNPSTGISLNSPYSLKVGHRSDRNVSLSWKFTKPANVELDDVTFVIRVLSDGTFVSANAAKYHQEPLRFLLTDLEPSTAYSVSVHVKCEGFVNSDSAETYFTTMMFDWPRPNIMKHELEDSRDRVDCTVFWDFDRKWSSQEYIKIEYCDPDCKTIKESPEASQATLPLEFGAPFNVTVIAVYNADAVELVERSSPTLSGYSPMGNPSRVKGLKKVEQVGNFLKIEWEPPAYPKGPVTYYKFEIFDAEYTPFRKTITYVNGTSVEIKAPRLVGKTYEVLIIPVNIDHENKKHTGPLCYFRLERQTPPPTESIRILEQTPNLIRFEVSPADPEMRISLQISSELNSSRIEVDEDVAEVSDLEPYTAVEVRANLCHLHEETDTEYCGGFKHYELRSNTAAPSPVENLRVLEFGNGCYEARWDEPLEPRGPIDGYGLTIEHEGNVFHDKIDEEFRRSTKRSFCNPFHGEKGQQRVRVVAFNYDLQNRTIKYEGTAVFTPLPKEEKQESLVVSFILNWKLSIGMIIVGSIVGFLIGYLGVDVKGWCRRPSPQGNVELLPLDPNPMPQPDQPIQPNQEPPSPAIPSPKTPSPETLSSGNLSPESQPLEPPPLESPLGSKRGDVEESEVSLPSTPTPSPDPLALLHISPDGLPGGLPNGHLESPNSGPSDPSSDELD